MKKSKKKINKKKIDQKAKNIRLIAMDVDGVLTDGGIIIFDSGEEVKVWSAKDRLGIHLIHRCGNPVRLAWITARQSIQVATRAKELKIDSLFQSCQNKKGAYEQIKERFHLTDRECVYIGDDLIDIPVLNLVGLSVCPSDAVPDVQKEVDWVSSAEGGKGVLREVIEVVLKSQGFWKKTVQSIMV